MTEGPSEPPKPESPRSSRLLVSFLAGVLLVAPLVLLLLVPSFRSWADETRQRLLWGSVANEGVRLVLERGSGNRLVLVFRNEGDTAKGFVCPGGRESGVELDVAVVDASGRPVTPLQPDSREDTLATEPRILELPPRTQATLELDLGRYVALPGPGRYRVTVERARLRTEEPRLRSNELAIDLP